MPTIMAHTPDLKKRQRKEALAIVPEVSPAKSWSQSVDRVFAQDGLRINASFFDPVVDARVATLEGCPTKRLNELATPADTQM